MKPKTLLLLMIAAGCGLIAVYAFQEGQNTPQETVTVLIVNQSEVPPKQPISQDWVSYISLPKDKIPFDAVTTFDELEHKAFKLKTIQGTVISRGLLTDIKTASTEIQNGRAVYTVKVDAEKSHSGQIRPKDRVDVFAAYAIAAPASNGGRSQMKTKQILSGIEIFSIDSIRTTSASEDQQTLTKTVSLILEPYQIPIVMMAEQKGDIMLALRNKNDPELLKSLSENQLQDHKTVFTERDLDELRIGGAPPTIIEEPIKVEKAEGRFWEVDVYTLNGKTTHKLRDLLR